MNSFLALCYIPSFTIAMMQIVLTIYDATRITTDGNDCSAKKRARAELLVKSSENFELECVSDLSLHQANRYICTDVVKIYSWFWSTYLRHGFNWMCIFNYLALQAEAVLAQLLIIVGMWFLLPPSKPPDPEPPPIHTLLKN